MIQKVIHSSLTSKVKSKIIDMIIFKATYRQGDRLNESEIASFLGVSKAPVREAFRELSKQGLVNIVPRKGVFVIKLSVEEIQEIFSLRFHLEESIYKDLFEKDILKEKDLQDLWNSAHSMLAISQRELPRSMIVEDFLKEDFAFHSMILNKSTLRWTKKILLNIYGQILLVVRKTHENIDHLEENANYHFGVVEALREKNLDVLLKNRLSSYSTYFDSFSPKKIF